MKIAKSGELPIPMDGKVLQESRQLEILLSRLEQPREFENSIRVSQSNEYESLRFRADNLDHFLARSVLDLVDNRVGTHPEEHETQREDQRQHAPFARPATEEFFHREHLFVIGSTKFD